MTDRTSPPPQPAARGPEPEAEADLLAEPSHADWEELTAAYNYGTLEPEPGTVEAAAFTHFDAYARAEIDRVEAAREADAA